MTKTTTILVLMTGLALTVAPAAKAQIPPPPASLGFLNVNYGAQPQRRTLSTSVSFPLYDETATMTTDQGIGNGPVFDISGGFRVWRGLAIGIGFSSFSDTGSGTVVTTIPHPLFFGQSKPVNNTASGLEHSERAVHLQAVWFIPVTDKIDVALSVGPSFIRVKQQLVSSATVPVGTQDVNVVVNTQEETAHGANVGFDGSYLFTRRFGVGLFIRYAGGSVDLSGAGNLKVGGVQAGLGARIRF